MAMGRMFTLAVASVWIGAPALASAQLLRSASDAVRSESGSSQSSGSSDNGGSSNEGWSGGGLLAAASTAVHVAAPSSSAGGCASGTSGGDEWAGAAYGGTALGAPSVNGCDAPGGDTDFGARLDVELGYVLGGAARAGLGARLQLPFPIDVVTRYSIFLEPIEGGLEAAALGRFGAEFRLVNDPFLQVRMGAGLRHFHDRLGGVLGGDGTFGLEFPFPPVIVSGEVSVGVVGRAFVLQTRIELGVLIDDVEIYAGYDYELLKGAVEV
ncbi:MAG TPA: hypothetical protein VIL20_01370, partial [Sandaracinaceae bacterium]